mmetsp:Transcript_16984/g.42395  ORF Transcript_16984/g.42395 Transcript_16984/m.42395 type:complete len:455 (+) Transcript_16984:293-1657(+)
MKPIGMSDARTRHPEKETTQTTLGASSRLEIVLGLRCLSIVLSYLEECEGTSFLLSQKNYWTDTILPLLRVPTPQDSARNAAGKIKRHRHIMSGRNHKPLIKIPDASTRLERLNTRRWNKRYQRKGDCENIDCENNIDNNTYSNLSLAALAKDEWNHTLTKENENENENKNTINTWYRVGLIPDPRNMPNLVGVDLKESLFIHAHHPNEKGQWKYLHFSNVLSYAMLQITGMTPLEFCLQKVFPYLGLTSNDIDWDTNDDGMQASFTNLRLHGRGIAKLAMLMMQGGKSSPTKQLLSKEYVETALSPLQWRTFNSVREPYETPFYEGFRWQTWISNDNDDNKDNDNNDNNNDNNYNDMPGITYASLGMWGQVCAFSLETNRLVVVQRSNTVTEALFFGEPSYFGSSEEFATMAMSKNFTFSSSLSAPTSSPTVLETVGNENENEKCYFFGWWCP